MIAKALEKENLLHTIHTIQISTNNRFASIEFRRKKDLEGFCKDGLAFDNFGTKVYFHPDYKQRPTERKYLSVSLLNVPTEADQDKMTRFVEQYFTVIGEPYYPKEEYNGIYYYTGTRVFKCEKEVIEHPPRRVKIFRRYVRIICDNQPKNGITDNNEHSESEKETNKRELEPQNSTQQQSNVTEEQNPDQNQHQISSVQQPATPQQTHDETPTPIEVETPNKPENNNPKPQQLEEATQQQSKTTTKTNTEITTNPTQTIIPATPRQELEEREISDSETFMSPAIVPKVPFTTPKIKTDVEINEAARFCVQLCHDNFFDLGRMVKIAPSK